MAYQVQCIAQLRERRRPFLPHGEWRGVFEVGAADFDHVDPFMGLYGHLGCEGPPRWV